MKSNLMKLPLAAAIMSILFGLSNELSAEGHITVSAQIIRDGRSWNENGQIIDVDQYLKYRLQSEFGRTLFEFQQEACDRNLVGFQCPPRRAQTGGLTTLPASSTQPRINYEISGALVDPVLSSVEVGDEVVEMDEVLLAMRPFAYRNCSPTEVNRDISNTLNIVTGLVTETSTTLTSKSALTANIGIDVSILKIGGSASLDNTVVDLTRNTSRNTETTTQSIDYTQTIPPNSILYGETVKFGFARWSPISGVVVLEGDFILGDIPFAGTQPVLKISDFLSLSERTIEIEGTANLVNGTGTGVDNRELVVTFDNDPVGCFSTPLDELLAVAMLQNFTSSSAFADAGQMEIVRMSKADLELSSYLIESAFENTQILVRARSNAAICQSEFKLNSGNTELTNTIAVTSELWSDWMTFNTLDETADYQLSAISSCSTPTRDPIDIEVIYFSTN